MSACTRLDEVHAFIDGEMSALNADAFRGHLATCAQCQQELEDALQLSALGEELGEQDEAAPPAAKPAPVHSAAPAPAKLRRDWSRRLMVAATGLAAAAALLLVVRGQGGPAPFTLGEERTLEVRLTHPGAAAYRPYNVARGRGDKPAAGPTLSQLARLEEKGDWQGVATGHLLRGEKDQAAAALAKAAESADVNSDRAAIALSRLSFAESLALADRALAARPGHSQALWNKALALRELGLTLAAAEAFEAVAALHEPGWAAEATERARALRAQESADERSYNDDWQAGMAWVAGGPAPSSEALRRHPGLLRLLAYDAIRAAPTRERAQALMPVIDALQAAAGGTGLSDTLRRAIDADFSARGPLAVLYGKLVAGAATAEETARLLEGSKVKGLADLRLGALLLAHQVQANLAEYLELARASQDPWFIALAAQEAAKDALSSGAMLVAEKTLAEGLNACKASPERIDFRCGNLALQLSDSEMTLHRVGEAWDLAQAGLALARAGNEWGLSIKLLGALAQVARLRRAFPLSRALLSETELRQPRSCSAQAYVHTNLANLEMLRLAPAAARAELDAIPTCPGELLSLAALQVWADLARLAPRADDTERLGAALSAQRASGRLSPGEKLAADFIEGRLLVERTPAAAKTLLRKTIAAADALPRSDLYGQKARGYSYVTLAFAASKERDFAGALELLAEEQGASRPRSCAVGVAVDDERSVVVVQTASGAVLGQLDGSRTQPMDAFKPKLTPEQLGGLQACPEVDVFARAPLHGRPNLLPPDLAWSYRVGRATPAPRLPALHPRQLVVADIDSPPSLGLPRLKPWVAPASAGIERLELRGPAATPTRVLKELAEATEVEIHAHGLADLSASDTSLLVLSADPSGDFALTAGQIRSTRLRGAPLVLLEGCQAAKEGNALHAPWSLPVAFIESGARAVLASTADLPDSKAAAFFDAVRARIRGGQSPAVALRDERLAWRARGDNTWTESILAFQ